MSVSLTVRKPAAPDRILHRLDWQVIRRLDGLMQGNYRTLFYGEGLDFADLREYQAEDDIRHIDWNVTARTSTLHVRQYVEEREITAWFLLDLSASMDFGPKDRPKDSVLVDLTATLARLLTRGGNQVGAILFDNQVTRVIPPRNGKNQVLRLVKEILRKMDNQVKTTTNLDILLRAGINAFSKRSLVFVISDFISEPGWERSLAILNRRHDLVGIRLWDPREAELPDAGLIVVEDAETGEQLFVDTSNPAFRRRFREAAERRETVLKQSLVRSGAELFSVSTEEDLVSAIVKMAGDRKKKRRARA